MPCKHFLGADDCLLSTRGRCLYKDREHNRRSYQKHKEARKETKRAYSRENTRGGASSAATSSNKGEAAEYFVAADLLHRGLVVTKMLNRNCDDDLYAKTSSGWITLQVKTASVNIKVGTLRLSGGSMGRGRMSRMTSDVLALVDLIDRRIVYKPINKQVPPELL